jgi:protein-S-isoprenylcysteine O-methyltransferase Ste14
MALLIQRDSLAYAVLVGLVIAAALSEVLATYIGQARDGQRRLMGVLGESLLLLRRSTNVASEDRWTKQFFVAVALVGLIGAYLLAAREPPLRAYADNWWTLGLGAIMTLSGIAIRSWAVWTLGRFFRREVTIEPGQPLIRSGPYRWVRHPAYAGNLLSYAGLGLAFGSWASAALLFTAALIGVLPRIRVEESALQRAYGDPYRRYRATTAGLIPGVW